MTAPALTPVDAIRFALLLTEGPMRPELCIKAIELAGYMIVPAGAGAAAPGATPPPPPPPRRGPAICPKCNKVRGNGGDEECAREDCPF